MQSVDNNPNLQQSCLKLGVNLIVCTLHKLNLHLRVFTNRERHLVDNELMENWWMHSAELELRQGTVNASPNTLLVVNLLVTLGTN